MLFISRAKNILIIENFVLTSIYYNFDEGANLTQLGVRMKSFLWGNLSNKILDNVLFGVYNKYIKFLYGDCK